jgi:hypothetical protein
MGLGELSRQLAVKDSMLCAENCRAAEIVRRSCARTAKALRVAVREVGMRTFMTGDVLARAPDETKSSLVKRL